MRRCELTTASGKIGQLDRLLQGLGVIAIFGPALFAQAPAQVRGTVVDDSGGVIRGALIEIAGKGTAKAASTGENGVFTFNGLGDGSYVLTIRSPGFANFATTIELTPGKLLTVDIALKLALAEQQVTVRGDPVEVVSVESAQNAGQLRLTESDLDFLADDPDELDADLQALAGPSAGPNGGQIYIDGFTGGTLPPKSSVREIRLNQNPFSSEYDRLGMGRIEILTKPGSDRLHGQIFFNDSNGVLNTRNPYSANKPDFNSRLYGGNFGGPVNTRASYFFSFERRDITDNAVISATTLDSNLSPVQFNQSVVTPVERTTFSPRLDFAIDNSNTLTLRYSRLSISEPNAGLGVFNLTSTAYAGKQTEDRIDATETAVISPRVINETRLRWLRGALDQNSAGTDPQIVVSGAFIGGSAQLGHTRNTNTNYEIQNYTTFTSGTHSMKAGFRVRTYGVDSNSPADFGGQFTFAGTLAPELNAASQPVLDSTGQPVLTQISSLEQYRRTLLFEQMGLSPLQVRALGGGASQFIIAGGNPTVRFTQVDYGLFFLDEWRLRPNLNLSFGLRYENQNHISDHEDFAPRVALAWAPGSQAGRSGKTVLRAGFGIFYDRVPYPLILSSLKDTGSDTLRYVIQDPDFFPNSPSVPHLQGAGIAQTVQVLDTRLRAPYILQTVVGVDRQLPKSTTVAVNFSDSRGVHQLRDVNINAPLLPPAAAPVYPFGSDGPVYDYQSDGILNQEQLIVNVNTRFHRRVTLFGLYVLGYANSDTDGPFTFPANQYNFRQDYGRSTLDVRHRFNMGGSVTTKFGLQLSPSLILRAGTPFDITTGTDTYGQSVFTERPSFALPSQCGTSQFIICTPFGDFNTRPGPNDKLIPRNYGNGPAKYLVNLRLSKTWGFGESRGKAPGIGDQGAAVGTGATGPVGGPAGNRTSSAVGTVADSRTSRKYNLTLAISVRNIININNPDQRIGVLTSPLFGKSNAINVGTNQGGGGTLADNRRVDLQVRLTF